MTASRATLRRAHLALGLAWRVLTRSKDDQTFGGADGNTFGLPLGRKLAAQLRTWAREQRDAVLARIPDSGPLPTTFPPLAAFDDPMAAAMTPILGAYWHESGQLEFARLGLDPATWDVTNPKLKEAIESQALDFCASTNATTSQALDTALATLKSDLAAGLIDRGEALPALAARVKAIFDRLPDWKADQIAQTEASRAVHAAQVLADEESGVVAGFAWLCSSDCCDLCRQVARDCPRVPLGRSFATLGTNPHYRDVKHPPLHPGCMCSLKAVLAPEYGGPVAPEWGETLDQPRADEGEQSRPQSLPGPEPAPVPAPAPAAPRPLPPGPIADRIRAYTLGDAKVKVLADAWRDQARLDHQIRDLDGRIDELDHAVRTPEDYLRILKPQAKLVAERRQLAAEREAIQAGSQSRTDAVLHARDPIAVAFELDSALSGEARTRAEKARTWLSRVIERGDAEPGYRVRVRKIDAAEEQRAFCEFDGRTTHATDADPSFVYVHEMGHSLEARLGPRPDPVLKRSLEFLEHRVGAEPLREMNELFPARKYQAGERVRKDRFEEVFGVDSPSAWYTGKDYHGLASEILSMGLQKLFQNPGEFAAKDPEYCKYVLGILDGSLR